MIAVHYSYRPPRILTARRILIQTKDLYHRRRQQNLTECVHPVRRLLSQADASLPELIQLIKVSQFDFNSRVGETFSETKLSTCPRSFLSCVAISSWKLLMV